MDAIERRQLLLKTLVSLNSLIDDQSSILNRIETCSFGFSAGKRTKTVSFSSDILGELGFDPESFFNIMKTALIEKINEENKTAL